MSPPQLSVDADLTLEVDGSPLRLTGSGPLLELVAERPRDLRSAVANSRFVGPTLRPGAPLGVVVRGLADAGLTVRVRDGAGATLATIGAGVDSRVGQVVSGSRALRLGSPSVLVPLLLPNVPRLLATAVAVGAVVVGVSRRRRRRGDGPGTPAP